MDLIHSAKGRLYMGNIKSHYSDHAHQFNFKADKLKSLQMLHPLALSIVHKLSVSAAAFL